MVAVLGAPPEYGRDERRIQAGLQRTRHISQTLDRWINKPRNTLTTRKENAGCLEEDSNESTAQFSRTFFLSCHSCISWFSSLAETSKAKMLDVFVNWLERRFKDRGKTEIQIMLIGELPDLRETQSGKDLIAIGIEKGELIGQIRLLEKLWTPELCLKKSPHDHRRTLKPDEP